MPESRFSTVPTVPGGSISGEPVSIETRITTKRLSSHPMSVPVGLLRPADSPRLEGVDASHAQTLAEVHTELPPILVHRPTMRVIDGMHRLNAAVLCGHDTIAVQYFEGSEEEAFLLAVEANTSHGLPLTLADRRAAAERIIRSRPEASDRWVAAIVGLAAKTVASVRRQAGAGVSDIGKRIGRDGRLRPLSSIEGRRVAGEMFTSQPDASLRKIAKDAGISVGTARDVRERIRRGEDPVPAGPRSRSERRMQSEPSSASTESPGRVGNVIYDQRIILERLQRDPSLRYTESGRSLLRWLSRVVPAPGEWQAAIGEIPPHCAIMLARMARSCSQTWLELADELDRRIREIA